MISESMAASSTWIAVAISFVLVAVAAKVWADDNRRRRQLATLMDRLERLESRLAYGARAVAEDLAGGDRCPSTSDVYSADVLARQSSHIARLVSQSQDPSDLADQAVVRIYRRIEDPIRPSDLADELSVSLRTLERGLERSLGCTPSQLILTVKMREARTLIDSGQLRIGDVAHRLSFADAAHLSRRYRRFYRVPPSAHLARGGRSTGAS